MASGSVCSAIGCNLYAGNSHGISFFRFPRDPKRCKKWITNCRLKDLEGFLKRSTDYLYFNHKLCANHFDDSQFATKMRNRLIPDAVPTLFNVPDKMLDPSLKATKKKDLASGDKATHVPDQATVEHDESSKAGKRKYPKDPSSGVYREMLCDAKLMLTPAVVIERVILPHSQQKEIPQLQQKEIKAIPQLQTKEIKENPRSQPEVVGPVTKTAVEREEAVKQLKQDLQKLKQDLDKERMWHKNHESYVEMVEMKQQKKDETTETVKGSQLEKQTNCEALLASPFWIKVEEASNAPDKKVYYVFSGIDGSSVDPSAIEATNLPFPANRHKGKGGKTVLSTSSNEEQGDGRIEVDSDVKTMLRKMLVRITPKAASKNSPYVIKPMNSNEVQGDGRIEREGTMPMLMPPNDAPKSSPDRNKKRKSNDNKVEMTKAPDSMVLVVTTADGKVKYKCTKCKKCFQGKISLLRHIAQLHCNMSYECNLCHTKYRDKKRFYMHLRVYHNSTAPYCKSHCHICGRNFSTRLRFEEHQAFHVQKVFGCNACKASFVEVDDLKRHLPCPLATAGMPEFLCLRCDETFYKRIEIQRHAKCNHSITPKTANAYEKFYMHSGYSHKKEKSGIATKLKRRSYTCETCGTKFRSVQGFGKHLPCTVKICRICEKQFRNKARLNLHMNRCHNNEAVSCSLCGTRFVSQLKLNVHMKQFRGRCQNQCLSKPFECNYCGQRTKHASGLYKHLQTHERKFKPGISKTYSMNLGTTEKLESDLQVQSSSLSEKCPIDAQTMFQPESDCEILSSSISSRRPINAQVMVKCESDPEFVCVD